MFGLNLECRILSNAPSSFAILVLMIDFIKQTIIEAGNIVLKSSHDIVKKKTGGGNFTLVADLESEKYIFNSIRRTYPNHSILSEETHGQIKNPGQQKHLWIIDPLDGTTNARYNIPLYAISIAYAELGIVLAGGVFDPNRKELFWAEKGKGAFCNDKKIVTSSKKDIEGLLIDIGSPYNEKNFNLTYPLGQNFHRQGARIVNFGSAALECAWVAYGKLGAYFEAGTKPWDIAAAQIIISEAGGMMIDPYSRKKQFSIFNQQAIFVGNTSIVRKFKKIIG